MKSSTLLDLNLISHDPHQVFVESLIFSYGRDKSYLVPR